MKRLQNKIAESRYALPLTALYALGVWLVGPPFRPPEGGNPGADLSSSLLPLPSYLLLLTSYLSPLFLAVSTYLMVELNNANALTRIYSRMVSCAFLVLTSLSPLFFRSLQCELLMLCVITFYTIILHTYQDKQSPGLTFYAFLALGTASVVYVKVLLFVPLLWLLMGTRLFDLSPRTFVASLLGLAAPWWFIVPWCYFSGETPWLADHFTALVTFEPPHDLLPSGAWGAFTPPLGERLRVGELCSGMAGRGSSLSLPFVLLLSLIGTVHYLRHSSQDKIRTQMIFEMIIILQLATAVFALVQPSEAPVLLAILIVNASVLIGHFIALTSTRLTNILFCLLVAASLLITASNLWMLSLPS